MLTGYAPFGADNPLLAMNNRLKNDPPPLAEHADVSRGLAAVVKKALARDPGARYAHANDFAYELANPEEGERQAVMGVSASEEKVLTLSLLAMIPTVLFALLFYVAQHQ
jgi:serine/threonine protein kinase